MSYTIPGGITVEFNQQEFERFVATQFTNLGITDNTTRDSVVNTATQAQINGFVRAFAKCFNVL